MEIIKFYYKQINSNFGLVNSISRFGKEQIIDNKTKYIVISNEDIIKVQSMANKFNKHKLLLSCINNYMGNKKILKVFIELHIIIEIVNFSTDKSDLREKCFINYGVIDDDKIAYSESVLINEIIDIDYLACKIDGLMNNCSNRKLCSDLSNLIGSRQTIKFSPKAASIIIHEIFGHPLEDDYYNLTTKDQCLKFPSFINIYNATSIGGYNLMAIDDEGYECNKRLQLIKDGEIIDTIKTKQRGMSGNELLIRLNCIEVEVANSSIINNFESECQFEVHDFIGADRKSVV